MMLVWSRLAHHLLLLLPHLGTPHALLWQDPSLQPQQQLLLALLSWHCSTPCH